MRNDKPNYLNWILLNLSFLFFLFFIFQQSHAQPLSMDEEHYQSQLDSELHKKKLLKDKNEKYRMELDALLKEKAAWQKAISPNDIDTKLLQKMSLNRAIARSNLDGAILAQADGIQMLNTTNSTINNLTTELHNTTLAAAKTPEVKLRLNDLQKQLFFYKRLAKIQQQQVDELNKAKENLEEIYQIQKENKAYSEQLYQQARQQERRQMLLKKEQELVMKQLYWREQLSDLQEKFDKIDVNDNVAREQLQLKLFEAQEKSNLLHLELLLARLRSQFSTLIELVDDDHSVTALNQSNQQLYGLIAQVQNIDNLVKQKSDLIKTKLDLEETSKVNENVMDTTYHFNKKLLISLHDDFQLVLKQIQNLHDEVSQFQTNLQKLLNQALARRQGLPGFSLSAWTNLAEKLMQMPSLFIPVVQAIAEQAIIGYQRIDYWRIIGLLLLEAVWFWMLIELRHLLASSLAAMPTRRKTIAQNSLFIFLNLLYRNSISIFVLVGLAALLIFVGVPIRSFTSIFYLALVWIGFKIAIDFTRSTLLESTTDVSGRDVRFYLHLKWVLLMGGGLTMLTVLAYQLPVDYEVSDFFNRLFMMFILITGVLLLRGWRVIPTLLEPYIDETRPYLMRALRLLSFLIPVSVISIGIIGFLGYVDFAWSLTAYEGIFLFVLIVYVIARGILIDLMEWLSELFIRRLRHGWLWTQAILRPLDRVLKFALFLSAIFSLFILYGWDKHSYVGVKLNAFLHMHLITVGETETIITTLGIIEFTITIVILVWLARWTREFSYRWIFNKTHDVGVRNSLAAFTQYITVIIGVLIALKIMGVDFTTINYILTALAIGIGFGLRDIAKNYVSGLLLLIERPVRTGDLVSIGTFEGEVTHIGMRAMTVKTWDNMEVLVPNSEAFEKAFTNWTHQDKIIRTVLTIKIDRKDDPELIKNIILSVLEKTNEVMTDPEPQVFLVDIGEALIEFQIRYFLDLQLGITRPELRSKVLFKLCQAFKDQGIELPYRPQDLYLRQIPKGEMTQQ